MAMVVSYQSSAEAILATAKLILGDIVRRASSALRRELPAGFKRRVRRGRA